MGKFKERRCCFTDAMALNYSLIDLHWQMHESYVSDNITYVWRGGTLVVTLYQRQPFVCRHTRD